MTERVPIIIPTRGRFNTIKTPFLLNECYVACEEDELELYKKRLSTHEGVKYFVIPHELRKLPKKREHIMKNFEHGVMIDDDLISVRFHTLEDDGHILDKDAIDAMNANFINMMYDANIYFGTPSFSFNSGLLIQKMFEPISAVGIINAGYCFFRDFEKSKVRFDDDSILINEDRIATGLNLYHNRMKLTDWRYVVEFNYSNNTGGLAAFRTTEKEKQDAIALRKLFGNSVERTGNRRGSFCVKNEFGIRFTLKF